MNKPSDEQLREIGRAALHEFVSEQGYTGHWLAVGRAAFEASCRIALATDELDQKQFDAELDAIEALWDWNHQSLRCAITQDMVRRMVRDAFCIGLANRLRSMTSPEIRPCVQSLREKLHGLELTEAEGKFLADAIALQTRK